MKVEIVDKLRTDGKEHIKISCANGDTIRIEVQENGMENTLIINGVDTYLSVHPISRNKLSINFDL